MTDGATEPCPVCGDPIKWTANGVSMRSHMRKHAIDEPGANAATGPAPDAFATAEQQPTAPLGDPPTRPKRSIKDRLFGPGDAKPTEPKTAERKPSTPRPKRLDPSEMLGRFWGWMGKKVEENYSLPTGRALQIEAEPAGLILTEVVKDTAFDRPVQWCARQYNAGSTALALFRFPVAVEMGARQIVAGQPLSPMVMNEIAESLLDLAPYLVKVVKREQKKQKDFSEAMEGLREAFGVPEGEQVTLDHVLGFLYPQPDGVINANAREAQSA